MRLEVSSEPGAPASNPVREPLHRNTYVWTLYLQLGLFSFMLTMIGPMVPYLQDEFRLDYTMAGLHQSAFALGMVLMGFVANRVIQRLGLALSLWGGIFGMVAGLLLMVLARSSVFTLGGIFLMSLFGTVALASIQTSMSTFGPHRGRVIMEANLIASVASMLVPLVLVAGTRWLIGWRTVFPLMGISALALATFGIPATRKHLDGRDEGADVGGGELTAAYWRIWLVIFFGVSVEWAIGFWCMTYLLGLPGASRELAAAGTVLLGLSAVAGRFTSSRIGHRLEEEKLFVVMMIVVLVGFPAYWSLRSVPIAFAGLVLCGFGAANFFPLALSIAVGHAAGNAAKASSMAPVAAGLAIGLAPLLLGRLSDAFSMKLALWYIPCGLAVMALILSFDRRAQASRSPVTPIAGS
jgi:fucose permease